jgi:hypothetical protein
VGRPPVYAGFDLDPSAAERSRLQGVGDQKALAEIYTAVERANLCSDFFFWNVSRPKREGLGDLQFNLLSVGSLQ